ncbi:MAG: hypothetical protein U5J63_13325 [Fodinibius sp.]|nr:hypothetical protein [Fodinibius sp.]
MDNPDRFLDGSNSEDDKFEKNRLLFIADLISLYSPITFNELISILKKVYGDNQYNFLHNEIRLLMALDLIEQESQLYYRTNKDAEPVFSNSNV